MEPTDQPLPLEVRAATPAAAQALILAPRECIRDLEAHLGQTSANSCRPPSSDPPHAPVRPQAPPSGRKRGGQPGHRGACHGLLPVDAVDEIVPVVPDYCRHWQQPFPRTEAPRFGRPLRITGAAPSSDSLVKRKEYPHAWTVHSPPLPGHCRRKSCCHPAPWPPRRRGRGVPRSEG